MTSSDTDAHPRPVLEEELPPSKQLKLTIDDEVPLSQFHVEGESPMVVEKVQGNAKGSTISEIAKVEPSLVPQRTIVLVDESDVSLVAVERANVHTKGSAISEIAEVGVDTIANVSENTGSSDALTNEKITTLASVSPGHENEVQDSDEKIPSKVQKLVVSLPTDLGAGTSAVQRTKTSLCSYFRKKGCRHGASCRYAHGEEELKPRPDGSWDPTSKRAKKLIQKDVVPPDIEVPPLAKALVSEEKDESPEDSLSKCIVHVPRGWSVDQFKNFLADNDISYTTAKKRKGMSVAFVGFKTPDDVTKAVEMLDGKYVNKKQLKVAESRSRSWEKSAPGLSDISRGGDAALDTEGINNDNISDVDVGDLELEALSKEGTAGQIRNVCDAVTPLAHMPYDEQLNVKRESITQVLKRLVRNTRKGIPSGVLLPDWIVSARDKGGLPCALEGVLASPIIDGYRNKCEFSIGCSADGEKVVGFQMGSFREGILTVAEPTDCRNVSFIARWYASAFQGFVRKSELPVWNKKNNSGFWRLLIVREGRAARVGDVFSGNMSSIAEVMLVVQVCPTGVSDEQRDLEYARMVGTLSHSASSASPPLPLTALLVQDHEGISNVASPDAPLHPLAVSNSEQNAEKTSEYIHDHISNLQFRISPTAFFQVNTLAAERLYALVGDWAGLTRDTLLFDVCCGTGTIGLTLAHRVGLVVGIEMNASAVADAQKNAEVNNITNCRFVCSKAEDVMESLLKEYLASEESDVTMIDIEAGKVESEDDGHGAQVSGLNEPSSRMLDENYQDSNTKDGEVTSVSSCGTDTAYFERFNADQVEHAIGLEVTGEPKTRKSVYDEDGVGRQQKCQFKNIVAIVDPPRVGLHPVVLKTLRLHTQLRRLVYISCNPQSLLANAVELCTPLSSDQNSEKCKGGWRGRANWKGMSNVGQARQRVKKMPPSEPFKPLKAIAVDLFPHTIHCEMVMLLER